MSHDYELEKKYVSMLGLEIHRENSDYTTFHTCPKCNDGNSTGYKHRFNWVHNNDNSYVNCFNCGYSMQIGNFIKTTNENIYNLFIKELRNSTFSSSYKIDEYSSLITSPSIIEKDLSLAKDSIKAMKYLKKRKLLEHLDLFMVDDDDNLIIPLKNRNDKLYGYQGRSLKEKFFWFDIPNVNKKFKVWNFFQVDWKKEVYIFEGVEDALSSGLDNIVVTFGKTIPNYVLERLEKPIFCFDNDEAGTDGMLRCIKKSYRYHKNAKMIKYPKTFVYNDFNDALKNGYKTYELEKIIKNNLIDGFTLEILVSSFMHHIKEKKDIEVKAEL